MKQMRVLIFDKRCIHFPQIFSFVSRISRQVQMWLTLTQQNLNRQPVDDRINLAQSLSFESLSNGQRITIIAVELQLLHN